MGARGSKAKKAKAKARPRARDVLAAPAPARRPSRSSAEPTSGDRVASERRASSSAFDEIDHLGDADDRDDVVVGRRPSRGRGSRGARGGARGDDRVRPPVAAWGGADDAPTDLLGGELGIADDDGAPPLAPRPGWCASRDDDAPAAETDDDANAATKWQRRKEEERRRREDKRVAAQQRQSKRQPPTTLRRRTSASSTGSGDPLDLLSPRSAIMHLDDVPLSDFDDADDEGGGEGGRMRPSSGKFTPAKNQPPDDGLTPMERAMKRAAEHRAAREADAAAAAAAAAEEHDGGGFGGREREEPYEMPRRGGGGGGARDAEAAPAARAAALEARAVELERKLAEVTRQADEAMMRAEDAERRAMRAEARAAVAGGGGAAAVAAARAGGLPPPPSWLATPRADDEDELPAYGRRVNRPSSRESPKPSSPAKEAFKLDEALDDVLKRAAKNGSSLEDMLSGAFYTLVPIRPRWRGERRSLRTFPGASLRSSLAFNPRPRPLSTPTDAFELHPDVALYGTTLSADRAAVRGRAARGREREWEVAAARAEGAGAGVRARARAGRRRRQEGIVRPRQRRRRRRRTRGPVRVR